jgi:hypothetical protein
LYLIEACFFTRDGGVTAFVQVMVLRFSFIFSFYFCVSGFFVVQSVTGIHRFEDGTVQYISWLSVSHDRRVIVARFV